MPRQTMKERRALKKMPVITTERIETLEGEYQEIIDHLRCPCCGAMTRIHPDTKRRKESRRRIPCWEEGPYTAELWSQSIGGSKQAKHEGEKIVGNMTWVKADNLAPQDRELVIRNLRGALEELSQP